MDSLLKDLIVKIAVNIDDDDDLLNFFLISKKIKSITYDNYSFWYNKYSRHFGEYDGEKSLEKLKEDYEIMCDIPELVMFDDICSYT